MQNPEPYRKKLIEVALPLNAISEALRNRFGSVEVGLGINERTSPSL